MIMGWQVEILRPFVPTESSTLLSDAAIAQTIKPQQPPQPASIDPIAVGGYFVAIIVSLVAIAPRIVEKYFTVEIASKESRDSLKQQIQKTQAELNLLEKQKELEAANNLANFYLETAREGQKTQVELLNLFVANMLNNYQQLLDLLQNQGTTVKELGDHVNKLRNQVEAMAVLENDILRVLNMKERGRDELK